MAEGQCGVADSIIVEVMSREGDPEVILETRGKLNVAVMIGLSQTGNEYLEKVTAVL